MPEYRFHLIAWVMVARIGIVFMDFNWSGAAMIRNLLARNGFIYVSESGELDAICSGYTADIRFSGMTNTEIRHLTDDHLRDCLYTLLARKYSDHDLVSIGDRGREVSYHGNAFRSFTSYNPDPVYYVDQPPNVDSVEIGRIKNVGLEEGYEPMPDVSRNVRLNGFHWRVGTDVRDGEISIPAELSRHAMAKMRSEAYVKGLNFVVPSAAVALDNGAFDIQIYERNKRWDPEATYRVPAVGRLGIKSDEVSPFTSMYSGLVRKDSLFTDFSNDSIKVGIFSISNVVNEHPSTLLPKCKNFLFMYPSLDWWERNDPDSISGTEDRPTISGGISKVYVDHAIRRGDYGKWFTYTLDEIAFMAASPPFPRGMYQGWFFISDLPLGKTSVELQTYEHSMNDYTRIANSYHRWSKNISKPALLIPRYQALVSYATRNKLQYKLFDDNRVHGSINGIPVSVSGHAINMMYNAGYGLVDFKRWMLSVENNILRFLQGKEESVSSSDTSKAIEVYRDARDDNQLIFDDKISENGLWHSYYDYVTAVEAMRFLNEMYDLPIPASVSLFSDMLSKYSGDGIVTGKRMASTAVT